VLGRWTHPGGAASSVNSSARNAESPGVATGSRRRRCVRPLAAVTSTDSNTPAVADRAGSAQVDRVPVGLRVAVLIAGPAAPGPCRSTPPRCSCAGSRPTVTGWASRLCPYRRRVRRTRRLTTKHVPTVRLTAPGDTTAVSPRPALLPYPTDPHIRGIGPSSLRDDAPTQFRRGADGLSHPPPLRPCGTSTLSRSLRHS
jgi:hypothetical protein